MKFMPTPFEGFTGTLEFSASVMHRLLEDHDLARSGLRSLIEGSVRQMIGQLRDGEFLFWRGANSGPVCKLVHVTLPTGLAALAPLAKGEYFAITEDVMRRIKAAS